MATLFQRNIFSIPEPSLKLAEFVGILLGDGCINTNQIQITLNAEADFQYIPYVKNLILNLFEYESHIFRRKNSKATILSLNGVNAVNILLGLGLRVGNKVKLQVDVPDWIKLNKEFSKSCLKGLIDTDGCIFVRKGMYKETKYRHRNMYFSNQSKPLRDFVFITLKSTGYNPHNYGDKHVRLYSDKESERYLKDIGSSNYRLLRWLETN